LNNSSDLAAEKIRHVADEVALKLVNLASSASDALAKLTATQAAAAVQLVAASGAGDHDLLIELKTMMKVMQDSVTKIETGNSLQIKDHEQRLDKLDDKVSANEKKTSNMFTIVTIYSIAIAAVIGLLVTHILSK